jgi:hypothetical protein
LAPWKQKVINFAQRITELHTGEALTKKQEKKRKKQEKKVIVARG